MRPLIIASFQGEFSDATIIFVRRQRKRSIIPGFYPANALNQSGCSHICQKIWCCLYSARKIRKIVRATPVRVSAARLVIVSLFPLSSCKETVRKPQVNMHSQNDVRQCTHRLKRMELCRRMKIIRRPMAKATRFRSARIESFGLSKTCEKDNTSFCAIQSPVRLRSSEAHGSSDSNIFEVQSCL